MSTSRVSRRNFLRSATTLAAAAAAPRVLLAQNDRAAPTERLALGIIGLKKMGGGHVDTLLHYPEVQIVGICDVDANIRDVTQKKIDKHYGSETRSGQFTGCAAYNEYEELLARPDIDAILIATPDHWHALMTIAACRAGKDVYCEKPLTFAVQEGRAVVRAARRYGRVVQTGSQQRSSPEFRHACELVRNGYIGELKTVHVECGPCSTHVELPEQPVPAGFDYERWLGPAPVAPYHKLRCGSNYNDGWRRFRDYSGGKMTDWGAHHFDIVQWALGMDESGPIEIIPSPPRPGASWDFVMTITQGTGVSEAHDPTWGLTYRYANGVNVIKDGTNGIRFVGTEGEIVVNRGYLQTTPASLKTHKLGLGELRLYNSPGHHQDWFACIRDRRRPICDPEIGHRSATVCHLGNIALWLGRAIRWDPEKEEIVGDPAASAWLDRPRRAPYVLHA